MSKDNRQFEISSFPQLREGKGGTGRTVFGYSIVFNRESVVMFDRCDLFREVIKPGAIDLQTLKQYDITMTAFHNREKLLARWKKGEGTLKLSVDNFGVRYEFEAPSSPLGEEILSSIKRGDMTGASFTFSESGTVQTETEDPDGILRHTITKLGAISEMTIAANPAYPDTTAETRESRSFAFERVRWQKEKRELVKEIQKLRGDLVMTSEMLKNKC